MKLFYKLGISYIYTLRNSNHSDVWKGIFILYFSTNLFLNIFSIWAALEYFNTGFSNSLAFMKYQGNYNGMIYFFVYVFIPFSFLNYYLFLHKERYKKLIENYPMSQKKESFIIHLILSWVIAYFSGLLII